MLATKKNNELTPKQKTIIGTNLLNFGTEYTVNVAAKENLNFENFTKFLDNADIDFLRANLNLNIAKKEPKMPSLFIDGSIPDWLKRELKKSITATLAQYENKLLDIFTIDSQKTDPVLENKFFNLILGNDGTENGIVISFKDSVVTIRGLKNVKANELIHFIGGAMGLTLNLEYNIVKALVFGGSKSVTVGEAVNRSGYVMRVGVGYNLLGRVVNPLGKPLDGLGAIEFDDYSIIERKAPGVITRKKVSEPVITGLKIVDALVPIGRGQRELILGDRKTGKTTIAVDTILNQKFSINRQKDIIICVYVAIGKRMSEIVRIVKLLHEHAALMYSIVVVARASDPASMQFIAPYSGCTMAEFFTYIGKHSLIIYDDLSKHADVYRQISLLLRRPVGREAYPGDVFFLHSRLLERAVKLSTINLAGSLTALPLIETIQGDVSAYIPTNIISITDGQIYLDLNRHQEGIRPAVDPGISVSRVGSSAQTRMMKRLAGSLKLELAQFREVEQFSKFGSELDAATSRLLLKGRILVTVLKQSRNLPLDLARQIISLRATGSPTLANINLENWSTDDYLESLTGFMTYSVFAAPFTGTVDQDMTNVDLKWIIFLHYCCYTFQDVDLTIMHADYILGDRTIFFRFFIAKRYFILEYGSLFSISKEGMSETVSPIDFLRLLPGINPNIDYSDMR